MDHKFKGRISEEPLALGLSFDFQNLFYSSLSELETGFKYGEFIYNIIRNPAHKLHKGETLAKYSQRLRKEVQLRPEHFFIRYRINYSDADRKRFMGELEDKVQEIQWCLDGELPTYRNESSCQMPFPCKFLKACNAGCMDGYSKKPKLFSELDKASWREGNSGESN